MEYLVPSTAFRYQPQKEEIFKGSGKGIKRFFYYRTAFTDFEAVCLEEFKKFVFSKIMITEIPDFFNDSELLRVLIGVGFNYVQGFHALLLQIEWRNSMFPVSYNSLLTKIEYLLHTGVIYIHGRDCKYRPIVVINIGKISEFKNTIDDYVTLFCFFLEFLISELTIPGKVENFVLITDLQNLSKKTTVKLYLQRLYRVFQEHYRYRLVKNYIVNASQSFIFFSKFYHPYMNSETSEITKIITRNGRELLETHCALHQFEEKFGGTAPNAISYWPPVLPPGPFSALGEPEEANLMPELISESDMCSISEKLQIRLPFERKEMRSILDISLPKAEISGYNVNVDVAVSFEDIEFNPSSHLPDNPDTFPNDSPSPSKKPSIGCCKKLKCLII